jgi:hypothetical protein
MLNIYQVPKEEVEKIKWNGDFLDYDRQLSQLGNGHDEFLVYNPAAPFININSLPPTPGIKCVVWKYNGNWIAKYFNKSWTTDMGYWPVNLDHVWERNPDISSKLPLLDDPSKLPIQDLYDLNYQMTWYIDPKFNPTSDKVWVMRCYLRGIELLGAKDMGYLSPSVRIMYNRDIPKVDYDFDYLLPWYDLKYEYVWYLDDQFNPTKHKIWAIKLKVRGSGPRPIKHMGYIKPKITYNPTLPNLEYSITDQIPYYELKYEHVWNLDKSLHNISEDVWAAKIVPKNSAGTKVVGNIKVNLPERLDVVFISYNEPNAETNWQRVLEKSPYAFRINGIEGIVNAHRCAAELATTDMFYVVDGDAYLDDDWTFNYQPKIFDRDCVHVWNSQNPVNKLEYGYGGVKLLPRELTLNMDISNPDMTTNISSKFKIMSKVSNITSFNTDEFSAWRSGFRECAKLSGNILKRQLTRESEKRLNIWCTIGYNQPYGEWAIKGAIAGRKFGKENAGDHVKLSLINNFDWLKLIFEQEYSLNR